MNPILIVIIILCVIGLAIYLYIRRLNSAWKGTLIDKQIIQKQVVDNSVDRNMSDTRKVRTEINYQMTFQTENDKRINLSVNSNFYNTSVIGDKFEKVKGEYTPKKIIALH